MTQYLDRFIPSRTSINFDGFRVGRSTNDLYDVQLDDEDDALHRIFLNTARKANYLVNYKKRISDVLNIKHSNMIISNKKRSARYIPKTSPWPVKARKQPLLHQPHAALDMPNINQVETHMYRHVIDWGRKGQIATIFFGEVHLWSSRNGEIAYTNTGRTVCDCLKWNRTGSRIAVSRTKSGISIIDGATLKCAAWHPWKNSILVIGYIPDNKISVWNINSRKCIDYSTVEPLFKKASDCILDYLTFCPMSGELVVSFYYENSDSDEDNGCNFLTVFSDLHTRVDEIRYHVGRVPYALWNQHGTKLATLSTDENLVIWDFFGKESKARIHAIKKAAKFPGIFDSRFQFGSFLR
ncbi:protein FIZZY-RELATED 1 isoform X2 [Dendroctonus ponderosae]|uniref:protein FIZZY-RELATED 1 isoform X2 n=1 Tax=Dendroctonus ponderosae TaxID=77166 RepID=UPI0020359CF4|nr:protein FIZZY-RELATED 1 isoform X2 [Dendroctonus ponderosae]